MKMMFEREIRNRSDRTSGKLFLTALFILLFSSFMPGGWSGLKEAQAAARTASVSGPWENTATWGGAAIPTSADDVTINSNVAVTINSAAVCLSVNFTNVNTGAASLSIAGTNSLAVTNGVTIQRQAVGGSTNTLAVGNGTLSAASIALNGTTLSTRSSILSINTGTVTISGNLTSGGPDSFLTFTGAGTLNIGGNFMSGTAGTFTAGTGTVKFNAAGAQTVGAYTFNNLTLSGSGAKTTTGVTVNGILLIEGTATLSAIVTYGTSATLKYDTTTARTANATTEWPATFNATGGVIIANTGPISLDSFARTFNASVPLTINSGATLVTNGFALNFGGNFINNSGTLTAGGSNIVITNTAATQSIAGFTTTGTVSMTKTAGTATFTGNVNAGALTINGAGGTLNLGTALTHTLTGVVTLTAGTLNGGSSILNVNATSATAWNGTGANFTAGTGTVVFGGAAQTLATASTFNNLTFAASGLKTLTGVPTVNGILSMEGTATVSAAPIYGAAATLQYNTATARTAGVEWITPFAATGGVIIANTGAITMGAPKVFNADVPLTINPGATLTPGANLLTLGGNFSNSGTFTSGSGGVTIAGTAVTQSISGFTTTGTVSMTKTAGTATFTGDVSAGAVTLNGIGGTLDLGAGRTHTVTGDWTNTNGTLLSNTSTVTFNGTGSQTIRGSNTWYNLEVTGSTARTVFFESGKTQTVTNQLTFTGASGQLLTLAPLTAGSAWYLNAPTTQSISYVSVSYSDARSGAEVIASNGTNYDGNPTPPAPPPTKTNVNWIFVTGGAAALTVTPLTWNVVGLDSNDVTIGPNDFPVGARVCNTGTATASSLTASFVWDSSNTYINIRSGTNNTLSVTRLTTNECTDFYFEVEVTRNTSAYDTWRRYHIEVTADGGATTGSTPTPREIYVEQLVSQGRNGITDIKLNGTIIPAGGAMALIVGETYTITLDGFTATQGYNQFESFINFPNTIFQLLSVNTTYTADDSPYVSNPNDKLYADACLWENNPNSLNYLSCVGGDYKVGGTVATTYTLRIISGGGTSQTLNSLFYDFSGSSYHYNSDYSTGAVIANIVDPANVGITKRFSPNPTNVYGVSTLTLTLTNPNPGALSGFNVVDIFPTTPGAMTVASPLTTSNTCGGTLQDSSGSTLAAGDAGIKLINGAIAANSSCIFKVNVTTSATGTYTNTTDNLFVNTLDTGKWASVDLEVNTTPPLPAPPSTCTSPVVLARWDMPESAGTGVPPAYTSKASDVATAAASYTTVSGANSISTTVGNPANAWGGTAPTGPTGWSETPTSIANYFQFVLDTHNYGGVHVTFDALPYGHGDWASPNSHVYVNTSADSSSFSVYEVSPGGYPQAAKGTTFTSLSAAAAATGTDTTTFRFGADGAGSYNKTNATFYLDNVIFYGCRRPDPPAITKSFSPDPVAVGGTSTLTFTITSPNPEPGTALRGISFDDYLPSITLQGTVDVTQGSPTVTGTGTAFSTQLIAGSILRIPSTLVNLTGTVGVTQGSTAVTGTWTAFSSELAIGSIISINSVNYTVSAIASDSSLTLARTYRGATASGLTASGGYKTYTVSSITDDTQLTLTGNYAETTASGLTASAGLTLTAAPTTICGSPVSGASGGSALSLSGSSLSGTVTLTDAGTTITGSGTAFTTELGSGSNVLLPFQVTGTLAVTNNSIFVTGTGTTFTTQLKVNGLISINSVNYVIASIGSNTNLTLSIPYAGTTDSGLNAIGYKKYTVSSITSNTSLTLTTAYSSAATLSGQTITSEISGGSSLTGTVQVTNSSVIVTGTGTNFSGQLEVGDIVVINSVKYTVSAIASATSLTLTTTYAGTSASGLTMGLAGAACTVTALVKANAAGVTSNISGIITAPESGDNTTSTGFATANLTAVLPPIIAKLFDPTPILAGGTSTLTFTITNPNLNNAMGSIAFSDTFPISPGNMVVASPTNASTSGCGTPTFSPTAGAGSVSFSSGTIAAGGTCSVTVNITAPAIGTYDNTSSAVSTVINSSAVNGNTASASLIVNPANPAIAILKQISTSATGPWTSFLSTSAGTNVYYKFTIENIGDVPLNPVTVSDPTLSGTSVDPATCSWTNPLPVASPTEDPTQTCVKGPVTTVAGSHPNTATSHGTYSGTVYDSTPSTATYSTTGLTLVKNANGSYFYQAGDIITYSYVVTNSGAISLQGPVSVTDDKVTAICPDVDTVGDNDNYLDPDEEITCTADYTVLAADVTAGFVTNIAFATVDSVTSNEDSVTVAYNPTRVSLVDFRAYQQDDQVYVRWETAFEHNTLGFNLLRLDPVTEKYEAVNSGLMPGIFKPHRGGIYTLKDNRALPGETHTYKLIEVENNGKQVSYGPFTVTADSNSSAETIVPGPSGFDRRDKEETVLQKTRVRAGKTALIAAGTSAKTRTAPGIRIKIPVSQSSIYFMEASDISSLLGISVANVTTMIGSGQLSLSSQGKQAAYMPAADNTGLFFYGTGIESNYTNENIYWLEQGKGTIMTVITGNGPGPSAEGESFTETLHFEQNLSPWEQLFNDPDADYWLWAQLFASSFWTDPPMDLFFETPGLAETDNTATIQLHLLGGSNAGVANDHHVKVRLNGLQMADEQWSGLAPYTITFTAPVTTGVNTLTIEGKADLGVSWSQVFINSFDVTYQRLYEASDNRLTFRGDGQMPVTVEGFTSPDIMVFDITNPFSPKLNTATTVEPYTTGYMVSLNPASASTPYFSITGSEIQLLSGIPVRAFSLSSKNNAADYIIIAPYGLIASAQALADYRKAQGYKTMVVDIENILNEFNYGLPSPEAIKKFLSYAYSNWKTALRYVVLAGDGSMDYKNNLGFGGDLIPSRMVPTNYGLFVSDNYLVDFNEDHVPEMAIGRLPVTEPAELLTVINKIKTYESAPRNNIVLLLADTPDPEAGDFIADSEALAEVFPSGYTLNRIYLDNPDMIDETRATLFGAINDGVGFFNYFGHAGPNQLSNSGLIYHYPEYGWDDLPLFTNAGVLPVMTAMTCLVGNFSDPYSIVLAEALLSKSGGGIAAAWAPTGLSDDAQASILNREFYKAFISGGKTALGDVVRQALSAYKSKGTLPFLMDVYNILGDPALRIRQ